MSQPLPARPNLEHLKNQAKDRLRDLQRRAPSATLSDALHAVAQEYGFKTWPELKEHVASVAQAKTADAAPPPPAGGSGGDRAAGEDPYKRSFGRYNTGARRALFFARYEAAELGAPGIEPEHVLLGVMHGAEGITTQLLSTAQLTLGDARAQVASQAPGREKLPNTAIIPFGAEAIRLFLFAIEEADRLQHHDIDPAHLLLAVFRQDGSVAASILEQNGTRLETMREEFVRLLKDGA